MSRIPWSAVFVVCWSSGFLGAELLPAGTSIWAVLTLRYLITAILLAPFALAGLRGAGLREVAQQVVLGVLGHGVFLGGVFGGAAAGVDAGTSALLCAMQPMLVLAVGRILWKEPVGRRRTVGLLLGTAAVALAVGGAGVQGGAAMLLPVASLLGLSATALLERRWSPRLDVLPALLVQVLAGGAVFAAMASATGGLGLRPSGDQLAALAWLVLISGVGGYLGYIHSLRTLGPARTSALLYLTPPVTTLWGWLMLGTQPTAAQLLALGLGAAAVVLVIGVRPAAARRPRVPTALRSGP